jgi:hypothetical protein
MFCNLQEGNNFEKKEKAELEKSAGDCDKGKQQVTPFNKSSGSARIFFKAKRVSFIHLIFNTKCHYQKYFGK